YQPLASDLRKLIAYYRMTLNLERIGDMIINIANAIKKIKDPDIFENMSELISNMLMSSVIMVRKSLLSYLNNDKDLAIWTISNDSVVDEMHHKLIKKAISKSKLSKENQHILHSFISINSILSNIERIADHATNIAEASIYSLEGKDVRHEGHIVDIPAGTKNEQDDNIEKSGK
ncbi:MAG TPA: PhoU domain-containing protein, partial [Bacteroidales bacterium]|nr:PhoU domain-containing protein [Bacteroidales bacterium]